MHVVTPDGTHIYVWDSKDYDFSHCESLRAAYSDPSCVRVFFLACVGQPYFCEMVIAEHSVSSVGGGVEFSKPVPEYCLSLQSETWEFRSIKGNGELEDEPFLFLLSSKAHPWREDSGQCVERLSEVTQAAYAFSSFEDLAGVFEEEFLNHPESGSCCVVEGISPHPNAIWLQEVGDWSSPILRFDTWPILTPRDSLPRE